MDNIHVRYSIVTGVCSGCDMIDTIQSNSKILPFFQMKLKLFMEYDETSNTLTFNHAMPKQFPLTSRRLIELKEKKTRLYKKMLLMDKKIIEALCNQKN